MLQKSQSVITKELDLQKFIHRQRVLMATNIALLNGGQKSFVDLFSQMVIRESSDLCDGSNDSEA